MASGNTIDKFGRRKVGGKAVVLRGPPGVGFKLVGSGNYDIQNKCLKNVGEPVDGEDSATRNYVDKHITSIARDTLKAIEDAAAFTITSLKTYIDRETKKIVVEENEMLLERIKNIEKDVASKGIIGETSGNSKALSSAGIQQLHTQIHL